MGHLFPVEAGDHVPPLRHGLLIGAAVEGPRAELVPGDGRMPPRRGGNVHLRQEGQGQPRPVVDEDGFPPAPALPQDFAGDDLPPNAAALRGVTVEAVLRQRHPGPALLRPLGPGLQTQVRQIKRHGESSFIPSRTGFPPRPPGRNAAQARRRQGPPPAGSVPGRPAGSRGRYLHREPLPPPPWLPPHRAPPR